MGCTQTTIEVREEQPETGIQSNSAFQKVVNVKSTKSIPENDVNINVESVRLRTFDEKEMDDDKSNALLYQCNMLKNVDSVNSGSSLSLSDLATYQRKRFPKFRGYRRCKYCTQSESLPSSFKGNCDSLSFEIRSDEVQNESESNLNGKDALANNKKQNLPRGLPTRNSCRRCSTKLNKPSDRKNNSPNNFSSVSGPAQFVNVLALNALDLTAPASDALLKNRKNAWVQLAGHPGSFAPAGPDTIWKKRLTKDNNEVKAYQALMNDAARDVVPTFYREVEYNGDFFIEMEDLLHHFHDPNIMDIKMGCRTFLEAEVKNPVLRKDLYEKMVRLEPEAPTVEEHKQKAITKLRYMQFRENESSTASLGFRLEAIRVSGQTPITDLKKVKTKEEVGEVIGRFINGKEATRKSILDKLLILRKHFEESEYFKHHELIGSSLLVMFDKRGTTGIWMIDFAKTLTVDQSLTHRAPWVVGNHEDGYLTGLDNLIQVFETMLFSSNHGLENLSFSPEQSTGSNVT